MDTVTTYTYGNTTVTNSGTLSDGEAAVFAGFMIAVFVFSLLVAVISIASMWKLFEKARKPGWASIIPIYNNIVMLEIVGRPIWWILLFFIPFANIVAQAIVVFDMAKAFGKDMLFGVLMIFFPIPMFPILAFNKNTQYVGPVATGFGQPAAAPQYGPAPAQPTQPAAPVQPVAPEQPTTPEQPNDVNTQQQ